MSPCPISGRLNPGFHDLLKTQAEARKTTMLGLQRRLLKNLPMTPLDLFSQNETLFDKKKK